MTASMLAVLAFGLQATAAPVGLYFEQTTRIRQGAGERAQPPGVRSRVWCQGARMRLEPGETSAPAAALVLRLDEGRALRLDPQAQTATELDAVRLRARSHAEASVVAGLMGGPGGGELRAVPLGASRTVAGYVCDGYRIQGPTVTMEVWVAPGLPVGAEVFARFLEWSGVAQTMPGFLETIAALPGFPLETRIRLDVLGIVQETVSTVTAVRVQSVPEERFAVPAGWRLVQEASLPEATR